jgi:hypothetical protein
MGAGAGLQDDEGGAPHIGARPAMFFTRSQSCSPHEISMMCSVRNTSEKKRRNACNLIVSSSLLSTELAAKGHWSSPLVPNQFKEPSLRTFMPTPPTHDLLTTPVLYARMIAIRRGLCR